MTDLDEALVRMAKIRGRFQIRVQMGPLLLAIAHGDQNAPALAVEMVKTMKEESDQEHEEFMALVHEHMPQERP